MTISENGVKFICSWEGFRSNSYQDVADVWTIGYGSTMWSDGRRVKEGETITKENAMKLVQWEVENKRHALDGLKLNQNQFDALLSFTYNIGVGAFAGSTLKKRVKFNPSDPAIRDAFMMWNKAREKGVLKEFSGLTARRKAEADLYFTK